MQRYMIRPIQHGLDLSHPSLNAPFPYAYWPSKNFKVTQRSAQKRWGYDTVDRELGDTAEVQAIVLYQIKSGPRSTLYLTRDYVDTTGADGADTIVGDLCQKKTGGSETFKYITEMGEYNDAITGIVGDTVTATGTTFSDDGIEAGDYFILNDYATEKVDFKYPNREPNTNNNQNASRWTIIETCDATTLTLKTTYPGTTSGASDTWSETPRHGLIRKTFKVPANERYFWMIAHDRFIFGSGGDDVKYWDGGGYAENLNASYAIKARCGVPYANRVFLADYGFTRDPLGIIWSKEGDSNDFTDSTSGSGILIETKDFITGLGIVGASLIIYKTDSIALGHRTGDPVTPISLPHSRERRGIGCIAPYSIVDFMGTNAFIGRSDFYVIEGDFPVAIGAKMRDKFFDIIDLDDIKEVYGFENHLSNELCWIANTNEGRLIFAWDYKLREWNVYDFALDFIMAGKGTIST